MVKGTEHGRVKWCEKTIRGRGYDNDNNKCATQAKVSESRKERERDSLWVKVADLCGTKSPLQRHQPLKARPPQHSIDLRNKPIFFYKKKRKKKNSMRVCMEPAQTGWAHMIGPRMGPKRGGVWGTGVILYSFPTRKAKWDGNPPPIGN